jgi:hypothetical protein
VLAVSGKHSQQEVKLAVGPDTKISLPRIVDIDSVICWHVVSPYRAAYGINNVSNALVERARECPRLI